MFPFSLLWRLPLLLTGSLLISLTLTACQTPTPVTSAGSVCTAFKPITFDRLKDTDETIREVKDYNAAWTSLCAAGISSTGPR
jgi:hypothetical protein